MQFVHICGCGENLKDAVQCRHLEDQVKMVWFRGPVYGDFEWSFTVFGIDVHKWLFNTPVQNVSAVLC